MRTVSKKLIAVVASAALVVAGGQAPAGAQGGTTTLGGAAIALMFLGGLILPISVAASVDAADCVPGQSLGSLMPPGAIQLPAEVQNLIPACAALKAPPAPDVAPAPGPEVANGRG